MKGKNKDKINKHIDDIRNTTIENNLLTIKMIVDDLLEDQPTLQEVVDTEEIDAAMKLMIKVGRKLQTI